MIHPDTMIKFIDNEIGYGIFATKLIPKGTITYIQDSMDTQIHPRLFNQLSPQMQAQVEKIAFTDSQGIHIVSWDLAKFVNHSCSPNSMSTGYGFEIALREIYPGEEITDEYGLFNFSKEMTCNCGSKKCRNQITPTDIDNLYLNWDQKIQRALRNFFHIDQPLLWLMDFDTMEDLKGYLKKNKPYKSVLGLKHPCVKFAKAA